MASSSSMKTDTLTSNDIISALHSNHASEKCRLGLADAVIYESGLPVRWYVTGSMGEVKLKRNVDLTSLSRRWLSIAQQLETNYVAAIRQDGGIIKYLTREAWESFLEDRRPDPAIRSIHCFLGTGSKTIIYRSHYVYYPTTNRWTINTSTYVLPITDPVHICYEDKVPLNESRATTITKVTDLATTTVVKYVERMLRITMSEFSCDYVIDKKSQIWMLWSNKATFYRSADQLKGDRPDTASSASNDFIDLSVTGTTNGEENAQLLSQQLRQMAQTSYIRKESHASHLQTVNMTHQFNNQEDSPQRINDNNKFPHAFKCHGDFCQVEIATTGQLIVDPKEAPLHIAKKFFTEEEILKLRKDARFGKMFEFGQSGLATAMINQRTINLARKERRGVMNSNTMDSTSWKVYPDTSSKIINFPGSKDVLSDLESTNKSMASTAEPESLSSTVQDSLYENLKPDNISLHYDQVRVCGVCYDVYQCLDWARNLLNKKFQFPEEPVVPNKRNKAGSSPSKGTVVSSTASINSSIDDATNRKDSITSGITFNESGIQEISLDKSIRNTSSANGSNSRSSSVKRGRRQTAARSTTSSTTGKATWKSQLESSTSPERRQLKRSEIGVLDNYIRGTGNGKISNQRSLSPSNRSLDGASTIASVNVGSNSSMSNKSKKDHSAELENKYIGNVLLACQDRSQADIVRQYLEESFFHVHWVKDGREASNDILTQWDTYDCVIMQRDLPLVDSFELSKAVRTYEKTLRNQRSSVPSHKDGYGNKFLNHRMPLICFTDATTPADLTKYMKADMDGCISLPVDPMSLISTVRAAIPQHLAPITKITEPPPPKNPQKVMKVGLLGEVEDSVDSATMALKTLPIVQNDVGSEIQGIAQLDADTKIPFLVMNGSKFTRIRHAMTGERFFNLVVCQDVFDHFERMKIMLQPIVQRYQGIQILVWNYPGQALTEWRSSQVLNNEYLAACLNELLGQVGDKGTKDFSTDQPFYLLGFGYGANIASYFMANYRAPNVRALINMNGFAFVDSYLAGVMHDCINVFQSTPESRPDLPVYFFSRFLFSKDYLAKVSVPLALNIYTAVYNSISIKGRIQLCNGVLRSPDIRPLLKAIDVPLICFHSNQDSLTRPLHVEPFVTYRFGEVKNIYRCLQHTNKTCIVWFNGGHEIFQENKKQVVLLLEQILTGYHEVNEVTYPTATHLLQDPKFTRTVPGGGSTAGSMKGEELNSSSLEDKFTKSVLSFTSTGTFLSGTSSIATPASGSVGGTAVNTRPTTSGSPNRTKTAAGESRGPGSMSGTGMLDHTSLQHSQSESVIHHGPRGPTQGDGWQSFSDNIMKKQHSILTLDAKSQATAKTKGSTGVEESKNGRTKTDLITELSHLTDAQSFPEVKEYMSWRLKRNKKRLQRLQLAAQTIQSAFRAYLARQLVRNIRRVHAARTIQRVFRGWLGRRKFFNHVKQLWATIMIQKTWRGYSARLWYFNVRVKIAAAANIQRMYRGHRARQRVKRIRKQRHEAACIIQAMMRRYKARKEAWLKRHFRNCSITIQRIFRGYLGKKRAANERDKYIFSKSQSQGIEFGRQMLLEHKLHVTKLQSDVTLLTQEKVVAEEQIEALLEEITAFEEGVRSLEKEMHQLSKVESEAAAFMDEDSKFELREQKMRLDREFGEMLGKIANRKDMLGDLEKKLATIDKTRQAKEEDLRTLERKLVVLLEDQQKELTAIRRKQDVRGQMLAASHAEMAKLTAGEDSTAGAVSKSGGGGGGGIGGTSSGPSLQEKKQAAQLMQSTETLMKFGFMSMSMTYFSSLNMIKALRTVSAQDTVMAALADVHAQKAVGFVGQDGGGGGGRTPNPATAMIDKDSVVGRLKSGQLPGQQPLKVSSWSVEDVAKWLQAISLGQYSEAFVDSAIDGEFLFDLNDDDLKNTLGIEHRLHRKKILNCINRLKMAEAQNESRLGKLNASVFSDNGTIDVESAARPNPRAGMPSQDQFNFPDGKQSGADNDDRAIDGPKVPLAELFSYVRHSKFGMLKDAVDYLPNKAFDKSLIQSQYVPDHGTAYLLGYERLPFHINKTDDHGNTMLSMACQNGNMKICKYLVSKGANPNHQNFQGQTPAHFAIAFKFFDLSQWLFENGGDDTLENKFGLSPYDGLTTDGGDPDQQFSLTD